jgi:L-ascorbate metabolism protein UlaG (beta-lactamase superfamily)
MRRVTLFIVAFLVCGMPFRCTAANPSQERIDDVLKKIKWTGKACFIINTGNRIIYIDPDNVPGKIPADIVLITHAHGDHCSIGDLVKIATKKTVFVIPESCHNAVELAVNPPGHMIRIMSPEERQDVGGVVIESTWAYDNNKHPKAAEEIGFIITIDGVRIYHVGGIGAIPEMKKYRADIVFVPVGDIYTAYSVYDAVKIAEYTGASVVIPMHYEPSVGTKEAEALRKRIGSTARCVILDVER